MRKPNEFGRDITSSTRVEDRGHRTDRETLTVFLSAVTDEFGGYRQRLADRLRSARINVVYQEEFKYTQTDVIRSLYDKIECCDVVIHFVGEGAGSPANANAIADFTENRKEDASRLFGHWKDRHDRNFFESLTYTQWEAVIAIFLKKNFLPLRPSTPIKDGHPEGMGEFVAGEGDAVSQKTHLEWLKENTVARYPCVFATDGEESPFDNMLDEIHGFMHYLSREWMLVAEQWMRVERKQNRFGKGAVGELTMLLTHSFANQLDTDRFLPAAAAQIWGDQFLDLLHPPEGVKVDGRKHIIDRLAEHDDPKRLISLALLAQVRLQASDSIDGSAAFQRWISEALKASGTTEPELRSHILDVVCDCPSEDGKQLPDPTVQAAFADDPLDRQKVIRSARVLWGRSTQPLELGGDRKGQAVETASAIEDLIYEQDLEDLPFRAFELMIRREDRFDQQWFGFTPNLRFPRVLRLRRKKRERAHLQEPDFPLRGTTVTCCHTSKDFQKDAALSGIFLATWCHNAKPEIGKIADAASSCAVGFWFNNKQPEETADRMISELDGSSSIEDVLDIALAMQKADSHFFMLCDLRSVDPIESPLVASESRQSDTVSRLQ